MNNIVRIKLFVSCLIPIHTTLCFMHIYLFIVSDIAALQVSVKAPKKKNLKYILAYGILIIPNEVWIVYSIFTNNNL